jgi:hypothetical protein
MQHVALMMRHHRYGRQEEARDAFAVAVVMHDAFTSQHARYLVGAAAMQVSCGRCW